MRKLKTLLLISVLSIISTLSLVAKDVSTSFNLRIMSYNIRNGIGMDNIKNFDRTAGVIKTIAPDFVALQEVDSVTGRSGKVDVALELAKLTNMYSTYAPAINYDGGKYGIAMLSKEKPLATKTIALPGREEERALLRVDFDYYVVFATHWSLTSEDRMTSIEIINKEAKAIQKPLILLGDLNAEPNSKEIHLLSKNWKNISPMQPTFPASKPSETIDYIWAYLKNKFEFKLLYTEVVNAPIQSDHRPIFTDVIIYTK